MDKRADRGMSGKMAGKTVKRVGTDSGTGSRKGVKRDKGGVRDINQEHNRQFALFFKHLDKGFVVAGGYVPINVTYVVTILIFTYFRE